MEGVRQGEEALRPQAALTDFVRAHSRKLLPRHTRRQLDAHAFLQRLAALHRDALGGAIAEVVALVEHRLMFAFDARLCRHVLGHPGREGLVDGDWLEACQPARSLAVALGSHQVGVLRCRWFLLGLGMAEPENEARRRQKHQTSLPRFDHRCLPVNVLWLDQTRRAGEEAFPLAFRQRLH